MNRQDKIAWMKDWAEKRGAVLVLEGECGFRRECVGIECNGNTYPDYEWYESGDCFERADNNGDVWTPPDAYHKHPCVAVLGRGEDAESQLYEWLQWFDKNGFELETGDVVRSKPFDPIELLLGRNKYARMVKK